MIDLKNDVFHDKKKISQRIDFFVTETKNDDSEKEGQMT